MRVCNFDIEDALYKNKGAIFVLNSDNLIEEKPCACMLSNEVVVASHYNCTLNSY